MNLGLNGKKALVFGASSGIGLGVAKVLDREGALLAVCSREGEKLRALKETLPRAQLLAGDLNQPGEARRVVETAIDRLQGVDVLVLNTGGPPAGDFASITDEMWRHGFQGLWLSMIEAVQTALPGMKKNNFGRILLIASISAREPIAHLSVSNGLRAGLLGLMKSLSTEVAPFGVTVNSILPGFTDTERLRELGRTPEDLVKHVPAGRLARPEELGDLSAFLCSTKAAYITGQAIACDGGYLKSF